MVEPDVWVIRQPLKEQKTLIEVGRPPATRGGGFPASEGELRIPATCLPDSQRGAGRTHRTAFGEPV